MWAEIASYVYKHPWAFTWDTTVIHLLLIDLESEKLLRKLTNNNDYEVLLKDH